MSAPPAVRAGSAAAWLLAPFAWRLFARVRAATHGSAYTAALLATVRLGLAF